MLKGRILGSIILNTIHLCFKLNRKNMKDMRSHKVYVTGKIEFVLRLHG